MEVLQFCDIGWAWLRDMHVVNKVARPSALFWSKYFLTLQCTLVTIYLNIASKKRNFQTLSFSSTNTKRSKDFINYSVNPYLKTLRAQTGPFLPIRLQYHDYLLFKRSILNENSFFFHMLI